MIEADLHSEYGIDLSVPGFRVSRSWRWLRVRIENLFTAETRIQRKIFPPEQQKAPDLPNIPNIPQSRR